ncbi:MAG TPA: class I SAM-dependent methyltransferase [Rudaea sp.]|jgi:SAM-dependent methyltransferase|nr:class I SAM-dependent methyltransferase [Rudaea sp.]
MENEFDRHADDYDRTLRASLPAGMEEDAYFARYKVDYLAAASRGRDIHRLLDFGCGAGRSLEYLVAAFPKAQVFGFDPSSESLRHAAQRAPSAVLAADWNEIAAKRFDVVFAANVFHHVARAELAQWLQRCGEALAPGGRLFVFEHNPRNPVTRWVFERCPFDVGAKMIPPNELIDTARGAGLALAKKRYTLFFPKPLKWLRPLEKMLGWLPLGAQYCAEFVAP